MATTSLPPRILAGLEVSEEETPAHPEVAPDAGETIEETDTFPTRAKLGQEPATNPRPARRRRWKLAICVLLLLGVLALLIAYVLEMGWWRPAPRSQVTLPAAGTPGGATLSDEDKLETALSLVSSHKPESEAVNDTTAQTGPTPPDDSANDLAPSPVATPPATVGKDTPPTSVGSRTIAQANTTPPATPLAQTDRQETEPTKHHSIPGRSVLFAPPLARAAATPSPTPPATVNPSGPAQPAPNSMALPPFGTLLPIRTVGPIFTLRHAGHLARLELTRAMTGPGWALPGGAILIGAVQGSERERVFLNLIGFIAPHGGFVKLGGTVLGGDGATGLRGQRRYLESRWARFFSRTKDLGLNLLNAVIAGAGRGTIIINDVTGRGATGVSGELAGVLHPDANRQFVRIPAGAPGYVMVTQLPAGVSGLEEMAALPPTGLSELADSARTRPATGLSESDLAQLLTSGTPEQIKELLPRMTPEMRRLAEQFLAQANN